MSLAIACASGGYRVSFILGVLSVLENENIRANAYAGTSGSVIPAALAAIGQHNSHGLTYLDGLLKYKSLGSGMSGVFLRSIQDWEPLICEDLWCAEQPRFIIPVSAVMTQEAAAQTQGNMARRLGRNLLLATARHDTSWVKASLELKLFDTLADDSNLALTQKNFGEVAYASSRMLHAWDCPAWIDCRPYIDASYTCSCPAIELAAMGFDDIIAISPEYGPFYHDLFSIQEIPAVWGTTSMHVIQPDIDLQEIGVNYTQATRTGLFNAYHHGEEKGHQFLSEWYLNTCLNLASV